ncbi:MAG TPA: MFS transporter, partial [Acidimicrobiales bacterium]|nr:MFS transporter [Acidimicrobiales bacterium]
LERRRLIVGLGLATAVALVLTGSAPGIGPLLVGACVVGLTSVMAQVLVPFAATLAPPASRGRVVGTVMSGLLLGVLLARTLAGYVAQAAGWRSVYFAAAGLMAVTSAVLAVRLPTHRESPGTGYGGLLRSVWTIFAEEPVVRLRASYGALSFGAFSVLWTSLAFLLARPPYSYGTGTIGLFGLVGAAGAAMASAAGRWNDRGWTRQVTVATAVALLASYGLILAGAHSLAALLAGIVVLDLGAQGLHITNQSEIYRIRPEARSRVNAAYMTAYFAGGATGSALSAALWSAAGWPAVCGLGAAFGAAAVGLWLATAWVRGRRAGDGRSPPARAEVPADALQP